MVFRKKWGNLFVVTSGGGMIEKIGRGIKISKKLTCSKGNAYNTEF